MRKLKQPWLELPRRNVWESVSVKLVAEGGEIFVVARSEGRQAKEMAMRRSCVARDQLLLRLFLRNGGGQRSGRPGVWIGGDPLAVARRRGEPGDVDIPGGPTAAAAGIRARRGPSVVWERATGLMQIETAFQRIKDELGLRPIVPQRQYRGEAHLFLAFLLLAFLVLAFLVVAFLG